MVLQFCFQISFILRKYIIEPSSVLVNFLFRLVFKLLNNDTVFGPILESIVFSSSCNSIRAFIVEILSKCVKKF